MGWLSRRGSLPPALLTVCCCGWARAPAVAKATPILELPNGFGMGKGVCEEMRQEFGMVWYCRDGWKMKMDWICQSKAALATLLIPVRMESRNCVPVLYRTTEGDPKSPVPSKSGSYPCPGCLLITHPSVGPCQDVLPAQLLPFPLAQGHLSGWGSFLSG